MAQHIVEAKAERSIVVPRVMVRLLPHVLIIGGAITLWHIGVKTGHIDSFWFSSPGGTADQVAELIRSGRAAADLRATLSASFVGLGIAFALSIPIVALISTSRFAEEVLEPIIDFVYAIPKVALIPVLVLT